MNKKSIDLAFQKEIQNLVYIKNSIDCDKILEIAQVIKNAPGNIIFSGIGKSGLVAKKIASALSTVGLKTFFVHTTEALHGELGIINDNDILFLISNSGNTNELKELVNKLHNNTVKIIVFTGNKDSFLYKVADISLLIDTVEEIYPKASVPTCSSVANLVVGDVLLFLLATDKNISKKEFQKIHPAGALGQA